MIKVKFFGQLRDVLRVSNVEIEQQDIKTVADILTTLSQHSDTWSQELSSPSLLMAVNQAFAKPDQNVFDGDEVAFFPPVTGG